MSSLDLGRRLRTLAPAIATSGVSACVASGTRVEQWWLECVGAYSSRAVVLRIRCFSLVDSISD